MSARMDKFITATAATAVNAPNMAATMADIKRATEFAAEVGTEIPTSETAAVSRKAGFARLAAQIKTENKEASEKEQRSIHLVLSKLGEGDFSTAFLYYVRIHYAEEFEQKFRLLSRTLDLIKVQHPEQYMVALQKAVERAIEYCAGLHDNKIGFMVREFIAQQRNVALEDQLAYLDLIRRCAEACDGMIFSDAELAINRNEIDRLVGRKVEPAFLENALLFPLSLDTAAKKAEVIQMFRHLSDQSYCSLYRKVLIPVLHADALIAKANIAQFLASRQFSPNQANAFAAAAAAAALGGVRVAENLAADPTSGAATASSGAPILAMAAAAVANASAPRVVIDNSTITHRNSADAPATAAQDAAAAAAAADPNRNVAAKK